MSTYRPRRDIHTQPTRIRTLTLANWDEAEEEEEGTENSYWGFEGDAALILVDAVGGFQYAGLVEVRADADDGEGGLRLGVWRRWRLEEDWRGEGLRWSGEGREGGSGGGVTVREGIGVKEGETRGGGRTRGRRKGEREEEEVDTVHSPSDGRIGFFFRRGL
jgi:hypothetical protein